MGMSFVYILTRWQDLGAIVKAYGSFILVVGIVGIPLSFATSRDTSLAETGAMIAMAVVGWVVEKHDVLQKDQQEHT